jgi:hypothetical protein
MKNPPPPITRLITHILAALTLSLTATALTSPAAAQEVDIFDGLLRQSQCIAWREDGPGRVQVACMTIDIAHCSHSLKIVGVGAAVTDPLFEDYLSKDVENECSFEGNAAIFREALFERGQGWKPLGPKLISQDASKPLKGTVWGSYPYILNLNNKGFHLIRERDNVTIDTWSESEPPEGVWLIEPHNAFIILTRAIIAHSESSFTLKVMQPPLAKTAADPAADPSPADPSPADPAVKPTE